MTNPPIHIKYDDESIPLFLKNDGYHVYVNEQIIDSNRTQKIYTGIHFIVPQFTKIDFILDVELTRIYDLYCIPNPIVNQYDNSYVELCPIVKNNSHLDLKLNPEQSIGRLILSPMFDSRVFDLSTEPIMENQNIINRAREKQIRKTFY